MITKEWLDQMKEKLAKTSSGGDVPFVFLPREAGKKCVVRVIDPPDQVGFCFTILKHYEVPDPDGNSPRSFNCLENYQMECPICKVINKYQFDVKKIRRMSATPRFFHNVLLRRHDEMDNINPEQVYVMVTPQSVPNTIIKHLTESEYYIPDLLDKEKGRDIIIERLKDNRLSVTVAYNPSPLLPDPQKVEEVMENLYDLSSFLPPFENDMLEEARETASLLEAAIKRMEGAFNISEGKQNQENKSESMNPSVGSGDRPECFGKYDSSNMKCLECVHEITCMKESGTGSN